MPSTVDKLEKEALEWLKLVTGEQFDENKNAKETLKDGTILCKAFNACFSDMKVKYTCSAMPFKQMENIATFLNALSKLPNFRSFDLFSTVDLYEGKNMAQVIRCVLACKRFAEKEAIIKGFEVLKVSEEIKKQEEDKKVETVEDSKETGEILASEDFMEESEPGIEEAESEKESGREDEEDEKMEVDEDYQSESEEISVSNSIQPEIVLIDSPVFAEDKYEDNCYLEAEEEFETFTQENPGTFEIQVSN